MHQQENARPMQMHRCTMLLKCKWSPVNSQRNGWDHSGVKILVPVPWGCKSSPSSDHCGLGRTVIAVGKSEVASFDLGTGYKYQYVYFPLFKQNEKTYEVINGFERLYKSQSVMLLLNSRKAHFDFCDRRSEVGVNYVYMLENIIFDTYCNGR